MLANLFDCKGRMCRGTSDLEYCYRCFGCFGLLVCVVVGLFVVSLGFPPPVSVGRRQQ